MEGHRLEMLHCDEEAIYNGRCECMERLAEHWAERELAMVKREVLLRRFISFVGDGDLKVVADARALLAEAAT